MHHWLYIANHLSWKSFAIGKVSFNLLENFHGLSIQLIFTRNNGWNVELKNLAA